MKYLIILVLVLVVAWQWRNARAQNAKAKAARKQAAAEAPVDVVACAHCGLHLPLQDAVQGKAGLYCDARHCAAAEH